MSTFNELRRRAKQTVDRISDATGLNEKLVTNVLMYAREMASPENPELIEKIVFLTQLSTRFGMTSKLVLELIYETLKVKGSRYVRVEDFVKLLCICYSDKMNLKVDFAFKVYDLQRDGLLDPKEIHTLLMSSIILSSDEGDCEEQVRELIEMVMFMIDANSDGNISQEEFSQFVRKDKLFLQLLGPIFPAAGDLHSFFQLMKGRPPHEITRRFNAERKRSNIPTAPALIEELYPVKLELP